MSEAPEVPAPSAHPDPFQTEAAGSRGGADWAPYMSAMRLLQDRVADSAPPAELVRNLTGKFEQLAESLRPYLVDEDDLIAGRRPDLPGRGHSLLVPFVEDAAGERWVRGHVTFTAFYLGGGGAAHGGTVPLLFDDIVGRLVNAYSPVRARTAYLHVNYRNITPVGRRLELDATVDRVEGRKWWASGRLYDGGTLCADAEGLFVELRPGQP